METTFISNVTFTPTEAAAFVQLPAKRIYQELEYKIIPSGSASSGIPFVALVYLLALKEINFTFSIDYRTTLYQRLVEAFQQQKTTNLEIARFFILQIEPIKNELLELIGKFNNWKEHLVKDPNIMGGEAVFPNSRLAVRHVGSMLERGESPSVIRENYPYLTEEDIQFSRLYVKAYPSKQQAEESDPWVKFAGMFKDDPLFDEFVEDMAAYRRELDVEIDSNEVINENKPQNNSARRNIENGLIS